MEMRPHFRIPGKIIRLGNMVTWVRNQQMQSLKLTSSQSEAIRFVLRESHRQVITAADLMAFLNLSQSTVAGILGRLEAKGLIVRETDPQDIRRIIIRPTEIGLELDESLRSSARETESILLKGMSDREAEEFSRLLGIALDNMLAQRNRE